MQGDSLKVVSSLFHQSSYPNHLAGFLRHQSYIEVDPCRGQCNMIAIIFGQQLFHVKKPALEQTRRLTQQGVLCTNRTEALVTAQPQLPYRRQ
jgi:hypothetical protein